MTPPDASTATLLVSCRDRSGIVAALSNFVFEHGGNVLDLDQYAERGDDGGAFFMRLQWSLGAFALSRPALTEALAAFAKRFDLSWRIAYGDVAPRVAVFVSKTPHCLYDLLLTSSLGELPGPIACVVSNHPDLRSVAEHFDTPFIHVPVGSDKAAAEAAQERLLAEQRIDLVVLARYMQILSPAFVAQWQGRIINIHHSFLPAFVGAKPYHQAKERGVKLIGATAHYVTADLDHGPIIDQDVAHVSHRDDVEALVRKGRDLERRTLTRAVRLHLDHRVLIHRNRTIVFG